MKLAEKVIKASKLLERMFLEQGTVADLGASPVEPEAMVTLGEIEKEVAGEELQDIVQQISDKGIEVEALSGDQGSGVVARLEDGRELTFVFDVIDGEPVLGIYTEEGRITVSLAPLIGYVDSVPEVVKEIASDEEVVDEFADFVADVVSEKGEFEELVEEPVAGEEVVEVEPEETGEVQEEERELEGAEESRRRIRRSRLLERVRRIRALREQEDAGAEERDEIRKVEIPPGRKVEYQHLDIEKGEVAGRVLRKMAQPAYTAKFAAREGQPDIVSFLTREEEEEVREEA